MFRLPNSQLSVKLLASLQSVTFHHIDYSIMPTLPCSTSPSSGFIIFEIEPGRNFFNVFNFTSFNMGQISSVNYAIDIRPHNMKMVLGDFNAKVGREDIFRPTIGKSVFMKIVTTMGLD